MRLRRTYWWLAAALVLTLCGLARVNYIHCEMIEPGWPAFRSDYVETRGFVLGWLITGDSLCAASLQWWQRLLVVRFLLSFAVNLGLVLLAWAVLRIPIRRFGAPARERPL